MAERHYALAGEIDLANAPELRADLWRITTRDVDLLVDCSALTFIDSTGIHALVDTRRALAARGHSMILVDVPPSIYRVLDLLGYADLTRYDARQVVDG